MDPYWTPKNDNLRGYLFSRFFVLFVGSFFGKLMGFIAPEMVPWLSKKSEDQPGGPRTNLEVFGDEVSFQYFLKNMKIDFPHAM